LVEFLFTIGGHKHTFQAANAAERDSWVSTFKAKITEAKDIADSVTSSDAYKNTHSSLTKPAVVVAPKKAPEAKKEEKVEAKEEKKVEKIEDKVEKKEEKKEVKEEKKEEKKARKSRSASRKRNSIFGSIGFGKKEDKVEAPKEEIAKEETPAVDAAAVEEPAVSTRVPS
jgi:hypothetical protein